MKQVDMFGSELDLVRFASSLTWMQTINLANTHPKIYGPMLKIRTCSRVLQKIEARKERNRYDDYWWKRCCVDIGRALAEIKRI